MSSDVRPSSKTDWWNNLERIDRVQKKLNAVIRPEYNEYGTDFHALTITVTIRLILMS